MSSRRVPSLRASVTACRVDGLAIIGQARGARGIGRVRVPFSRGRDTRTHEKQNPPGRRVCIPGRGRESSCSGRPELPLPRRISQAPLACTGKVCPKSAASGRVLLHPGGPMLAFVPVAFDVYRPLKPRLRWAMACLVSFADHAGRCFPSVAHVGRARRHLEECRRARPGRAGG